MKPLPQRLTLLCLPIAFLASCAREQPAPPPPAPAIAPLVGATERSPHFEAVNSHLELGGVFYAYADVDGDVREAAPRLEWFAKQIAAAQPSLSMFAKQDFGSLISLLGLDDVDAIGCSSVRTADGYYRNRTFIYTPKGRHGFLSIFGTNPGPFVNARMAPPDADFYTEFDFDLKAIYDTTVAVVEKVNGPQAAADFRARVKEAGKNSHFSLLDLIDGLKGRAAVVLRFDPEKNFQLPLPGAVTIPVFSLLVRVDGVGPAIEGYLKSSPGYEVSTTGPLRVYTPKAAIKINGESFVLAFEGNAFYLASSKEFAAECATRAQGLDKDPAFSAALASLGPEGNGVSWVTPRFFSRLKELATMNAQASPQSFQILKGYSDNLPQIPRPMISVRTNLPDGILIRSDYNRSLKADVALFSVYNPVTIGLVAAMAIPAIQKVRQNAELKAAQNNLHMLSDAADRYYEAHHVSECSFSDIVGPGKAIESVTPVAGERYESLIFIKGRPLRLRLPDGRVAFYGPPGKRYNLIRVPTPTPTAAPGTRRTDAPSFEQSTIPAPGEGLTPAPIPPK